MAIPKISFCAFLRWKWIIIWLFWFDAHASEAVCLAWLLVSDHRQLQMVYQAKINNQILAKWWQSNPPCAPCNKSVSIKGWLDRPVASGNSNMDHIKEHGRTRPWVDVGLLSWQLCENSLLQPGDRCDLVTWRMMWTLIPTACASLLHCYVF